ncbi:M14 family zinc carboxypeptidase [Isoptericola variabilis]|uniref:M14 family zinc carboxypeptidase n=1 Tax=Isoptericola variabilis TaxID=139208 RepID=UPI00117C04FD|nr:M14 family zinc carboxypeptidase [Isoptericola variabilis]
MLSTAQAAPADGEPPGLAVATVHAATPEAQHRLAATGLDVIHADAEHAEVLLHTPQDRLTLALGDWEFELESVEDDLDRMEAARAHESRLEARLAEDPSVASTLPTGRVSYREIDDAEAEMRALAAEFPEQVRLFELPHPSLLGRTVLGLEVAGDVATSAGEPTYLLSGVHHAREWPTLELVLEFVTEAVHGYGTDERFTAIMDSSRMLVVPVVNPDGYMISRERINEMKRKNCRVLPGATPTWEECAAAQNANAGVDPNRNYGPFWGGPGSSVSGSASNHHGAAPYSEPEIENMRELMNSHQVTVAINAHTPDERLLRAPSSPLEPEPVDADAYQALAEELGDALGGWPAGPWTEVYYVASGTAEEHGLYVNGTFGFTPELMPGFDGLDRFHPPYEYVDDQYWGTGRYEGSSAREAFLLAWEKAADPALHGVVTGTAPRGIELTISKDVEVESSPTAVADGGTIATAHELRSTLRVPDDGTFTWHVNPSVRQSQESSTLLEETWTISCTNPAGRVHHEVEVVVGRGETVDVDMTACPGGPKLGRG